MEINLINKYFYLFLSKVQSENSDHDQNHFEKLHMRMIFPKNHYINTNRKTYTSLDYISDVNLINVRLLRVLLYTLNIGKLKILKKEWLVGHFGRIKWYVFRISHSLLIEEPFKKEPFLSKVQ